MTSQRKFDDLHWLRRIRRSIHRWPETGREEHRTSALIIGILTGLGLEIVEPMSTSVATIIGPPGRPAVALRAELDAIACTERTGLSFASERPGLMHACGHDGHVAALVVVARRLALHPPAAPVLLIFQQAEETHPSGAPQVIEGLGPDLWPAEQAYGFHLWPELPEGIIGLRSGPLMAGITGIDIAFRAPTGRDHGTRVDAGAGDAVRAMWRLCTALSELPGGRWPTETQPVTLHVGSARAGETPNRPAEQGLVRATLRWLRRDAHDDCVEKVRKIANQTKDETGVDVTVSLERDIRPLIENDPAAAERVTSACEDATVHLTEHPDSPLGVSDDFGHYLRQASGAFFLLGCGQPKGTADLHSSRFDFREEVLLPAVDVLERLARQE